MKDALVLYQERKFVGILTFRTAQSTESYQRLIAELRELTERMSSDKGVRALILQGECGFALASEQSDLFLTEEQNFSVSWSIASLRFPTIAAIEGKCYGQSLELALSCDLRICTEDARFSMNHLTLGQIPWDGGTQCLPRTVGIRKAMEMVLAGAIIDAGKAREIGLVNKVVPPEKLEATVMKQAEDVAEKAPIAASYAKEAVQNGMELSLQQGLRLEGDLYFLLQTTRDREEGISAFREKRSPKFYGS